MDNPFLSIITRHCKYSGSRLGLMSKGKELNRNLCLKINIESVFAQTDNDLEHIIIEDPNINGSGLHWANQSFFHNVNRINGKYIFILDDDEYLTDINFVKELKLVDKANDPLIIFVKFNHGLEEEPIILPSNWGKKPVQNKIGTSCFVIKNKLWKKYIKNFGTKYSGDFSFINSIYNNEKRVDRFFYLDKIIGITNRERIT